MQIILSIEIFLVGFLIGLIVERRNLKHNKVKKDNNVQLIECPDNVRLIEQSNTQKNKIEQNQSLEYIVSFDTLEEFRDFQQYYKHYSRGSFITNPVYVKILENGTYVSWIKQKGQPIFKWSEIKRKARATSI